MFSPHPTHQIPMHIMILCPCNLKSLTFQITNMTFKRLATS